MDKPVARRIVAYLRDVGELSDPRSRGRALTGNLARLWRYQVGDYRITVDIHDAEMIILAVQVGRRSSVHDQPGTTSLAWRPCRSKWGRSTPS